MPESRLALSQMWIKIYWQSISAILDFKTRMSLCYCTKFFNCQCNFIFDTRSFVIGTCHNLSTACLVTVKFYKIHERVERADSRATKNSEKNTIYAYYRRTVVQNAEKSDKNGKNEKFTSITKIINLTT